MRQKNYLEFAITPQAGVTLEESDVVHGCVGIDELEEEDLDQQVVRVGRLSPVILPIIQLYCYKTIHFVQDHNHNCICNTTHYRRYHRIPCPRNEDANCQHRKRSYSY